MKDTGGGYSCDACWKMIDRDKDPHFVTVTFRVSAKEPGLTTFHFHPFCLRRATEVRWTAGGRTDLDLDQAYFHASLNVLPTGHRDDPV